MSRKFFWIAVGVIAAVVMAFVVVIKFVEFVSSQN